MPNKPWTKAELDSLVDQANNKKKSIKIPSRSKKSVRRKLFELKLVKPKFKIRPHNKRAWTNEEINILKSSDARKVKINNRSRSSIIRMANYLGLLKNKKPANKPWKKKEEKLLILLAKKGNTPKQIFDMKVLPYSRNSIQKKMSNFGFSKKSNVKKFPPVLLMKFKSFLKENWQGNTPQELADSWNKQNSFQVKKSNVAYHLSAMKIKISYGEVFRISNLRKKEEKIKQTQPPKDALENVRLARAKMMRERLTQNRDIWTGLATLEVD
jgi:hypothetical protein